MMACTTIADRRADAGLTLVEVLVALTIVGVAAGAAVIGIDAASRDTRIHAEAVRLAQSLGLGVDTAMIARSPLAMLWTMDGYRFVQWSNEAGWKDPSPRRLAAPHVLSAGLELQATGTAAGSPLMINASGIGPTTRFRLLGSGDDWIVDFDGFAAVVRESSAP